MTKTKVEFQAENESLRSQNQSLQNRIELLSSQIRSNNLSKITVQVIRTFGYVACFYLSDSAIEALAGKLTMADFGLTLNGDLCKIDCKWALGAGVAIAVIGVLAGVFGIIYGKWQREMRQDVIESKSQRIQDLERLLDPSRSSSGLTRRGNTRKEDK